MELHLNSHHHKKETPTKIQILNLLDYYNHDSFFKALELNQLAHALTNNSSVVDQDVNSLLLRVDLLSKLSYGFQAA